MTLESCSEIFKLNLFTKILSETKITSNNSIHLKINHDFSPQEKLIVRTLFDNIDH